MNTVAMMRWAACCFVLFASIAAAPAVMAEVIVDDSWADGGRDDGADPLDSNWWTSSSSSGIEVSVGSLGLVTGSSGRGIHTVFPTQTLANVGDKLIATYTFTTPDTVGARRSTGFRVGLFDTLGRAGLNDNISASSSSPNAVYGYHADGTDALPGYMMDMDVNTDEDDIAFRQHDTTTVPGVSPTGRLMGTTDGFTSISPSGPDEEFEFEPNSTYTGSLTIVRSSATEMELIGTLSGPFGTTSHSVTDAFDSANFGMLGFWANSNVFGDANTPDTPDNGADFSNVRIEFIAIPEPASMCLMLSAASLLALARRRASS